MSAVIDDFRAITKQKFRPINGLSAESIEEGLKEHVLERLREFKSEIFLEDVIIYGSRARGLENKNSDLNVLISYYSEVSESAFTHVLNKEDMHINGIPIEFNAIRRMESGPLDAYLARADNYLNEKAKNDIPQIEANMHMTPRKEGSNLLAIGELTINNMLVIKNITVREKRKRDPETKQITDEKTLYVSLPWKKEGEGFTNIIDTSNPEIKKTIDSAVFAALKKEIYRAVGWLNIEVKDVDLVNQKQVKGLASVELEGLIIKDIRIVEGKNGLFVGMPQYRGNDGEYHDLVFSLGAYERTRIQDEVLAAYQIEVNKLRPETAQNEPFVERNPVAEKEQKVERAALLKQYENEFSEFPPLTEPETEKMWEQITEETKIRGDLSVKEKIDKMNAYEDLRKKFDSLCSVKEINPQEKLKPEKELVCCVR